MQIKRIHPDNWYQTKQGVGKFLSFAGPKLKFEIDGKTVYLSSSDVQHEIAKGEEPQDETAAIPPDVEKIVAELHRLRASNAALLEACEAMLSSPTVELEAEITSLKRLNEDLAERVAKQSELLSKRAEKKDP